MQLELITRKPTSAAHSTPILFVHGAWHGAWCWDEYFMPYFAQQGYTTFALSYRGHGNSDGRDSLLRNLAREANEGYALALDEVLRTSPWYADAYRWRASARAASGQRDGAVRDVLCYRLAARDSTDRALADRALVALAAADTIAALTMLKN